MPFRHRWIPVRTPLTLATLLCLGLLLSACGPQATVKPQQPAPPPDAHAWQLLQQGQPAEAAKAFMALAAGSEAKLAQGYRLHAADAYLQAGDMDSADRILKALPGTGLEPAQSGLRTLLLGEISLQRHQPRKALDEVRSLDLKALAPPLQARVYRLHAAAYDAMGNALESARARVVLDTYLSTEAGHEANNAAIWADLKRIRPKVLSELLPPKPDTLSGWMELSIIARTDVLNTDLFAKSIASWQQRYPDHPGMRSLVPKLTEASKVLDVSPASLALLLPSSGRFANAAAAIRDGFLSAWYEDSRTSKPAAIHLFDANAANIDSVYQQAVSAGTELIVGPLDKAAVETLAGRTELPVLTLALNQVGQPASSSAADARHRLLQFALTPEDEARQVAERAWFDGYINALALTPEGDWGQRVIHAFSSRWLELGGKLLSQQAFKPGAADLSAPVKRLLAIDASERRRKRLQATLGVKLKFEVRRRQDVDFVFMAAYPRDARQLRPLLRFFHASQVPVYATSQVFSGQPDAEVDRDLDGLIFADMPWVIDRGGDSPALYHQIQRDWPRRAARYTRLFALGIDAYGLIPHLGRLQVNDYASYEGETGSLSMDAGGHIHRQLSWARFQDGLPVPLNTEATPSLSARLVP